MLINTNKWSRFSPRGNVTLSSSLLIDINPLRFYFALLLLLYVHLHDKQQKQAWNHHTFLWVLWSKNTIKKHDVRRSIPNVLLIILIPFSITYPLFDNIRTLLQSQVFRKTLPDEEKGFLKDIDDLHLGCVEAQNRGSLHSHVLFWSQFAHTSNWGKFFFLPQRYSISYVIGIVNVLQNHRIIQQDDVSRSSISCRIFA